MRPHAVDSLRMRALGTFLSNVPLSRVRQHTVSIRQNTAGMVTHTSRALPKSRRTCGALSRSAPAYVSNSSAMRQHTSAYVSIRQHRSCTPPAPSQPSIRQHTAAYGSIRQHTAAYGHIRQRRSCTCLELSTCPTCTLLKAATSSATSTLTGIRQHAVSIRQHTSAPAQRARCCRAATSSATSTLTGAPQQSRINRFTTSQLYY
jgi:hypothetical protein